jgi:hypothetical protein
MPLATGQTLTHYEILGPLGAGGMGEVYRARDTRLDREVAIKVLPEHFAEDDERLQRFEREAKTLASLNHPNVAGIHAIDQVDDTCFLAMELVPGEDLATRLARGPLPVDEAIDVCRQIAEGLEAAHEAGVVHRDLKPANVRVTPDGVVKVLDFGLAKPIRPKTSSESGATTAESDSFLMTEEGLVLGTPTYMSPEQARGKPVDRRTDIWAFGCVLYECLTGKRAFDGESMTDVLASIVGKDPDWSRLPGGVEPHVLRLVRRCIEKDPRERLRDVGEARITLGRGTPEPVDRPRESPRSRHVPVLAVGIIALALGALGAWFLRPEEGGASRDVAATTARRTLRLTVPLFGARRANAELLSPDGRGIVFQEDGWLWLHDFADTEPSRIPGTENCEAFLAWSPDAESIAFKRGGHLETLRIGESRGERRCPMPEGSQRCSWSDDDAFLIEAGGKSEGVFYVAPGEDELVRLDWLDPETLTTPQRFNPSFLPGGDRFLINAPSGDEPWIHVASLSTRTTEPLLRGGNRAEYVHPGYLAWVDRGRLHVQPFDAESTSLVGSPRELAGDVNSFASTGTADFSFSSVGTLVYRPMEQPNRIEWLDRQGRVLGPATDPLPYAWVRLDRTGRWLAASVITPSSGYRDLWLVDLERGTPQRFTDQLGWESTPAWSPEGQRIAFAADWTGPPNVHLKEVSGGPPRELVPFDNRVQYVGSWSSDGRWVLYMSLSTGTRKGDLWRVEVETLECQPLLETPADERSPMASPDGRWIAFSSDESGGQEVYVGTYPDLKGVRRVSNEGGAMPRWRGDSSELHYLTDAKAIVSVAIRETDGLPDPDPEVIVIQPMEDLFTFDVTSDAERFLVVRQSEAQVRPVLHLIVGWEGLLE